MRDAWREECSRPERDRSVELCKLDGEIREIQRLIESHVLSATIGGAALEKAERERQKLMLMNTPRNVINLDFLKSAESAYRNSVARMAEALAGRNIDLARETLQALMETSALPMKRETT